MLSKYDYNSFLRYDSALNPFKIFNSVWRLTIVIAASCHIYQAFSCKHALQASLSGPVVYVHVKFTLQKGHNFLVRSKMRGINPYLFCHLHSLCKWRLYTKHWHRAIVFLFAVFCFCFLISMGFSPWPTRVSWQVSYLCN